MIKAILLVGVVGALLFTTQQQYYQTTASAQSAITTHEQLMAKFCGLYATRWNAYFTGRGNTDRVKCVAYEYVSVYYSDTGIEYKRMVWKDFMIRGLDLKMPPKGS